MTTAVKPFHTFSTLERTYVEMKLARFEEHQFPNGWTLSWTAVRRSVNIDQGALKLPLFQKKRRPHIKKEAYTPTQNPHLRVQWSLTEFPPFGIWFFPLSVQLSSSFFTVVHQPTRQPTTTSGTMPVAIFCRYFIVSSQKNAAGFPPKGCPAHQRNHSRTAFGAGHKKIMK